MYSVLELRKPTLRSSKELSAARSVEYLEEVEQERRWSDLISIIGAQVLRTLTPWGSSDFDGRRNF